jgi:hypothetical protein
VEIPSNQENRHLQISVLISTQITADPHVNDAHQPNKPRAGFIPANLLDLGTTSVGLDDVLP